MAARGFLLRMSFVMALFSVSASPAVACCTVAAPCRTVAAPTTAAASDSAWAWNCSATDDGLEALEMTWTSFVPMAASASDIAEDTASGTASTAADSSGAAMLRRRRMFTPPAQTLVVTAETTPSRLRVSHMREPKLLLTATMASPTRTPASSADPPASTSDTRTGPSASGWASVMPMGLRTVTSIICSTAPRALRFSSASSRSNWIVMVGDTARRVCIAEMTPDLVRFSHMPLPMVADVATMRSPTRTPPRSAALPGLTVVMKTPVSSGGCEPQRRSSNSRPTEAPSSTS
mmetsp:Transcript_20194/g.61289  ORF Transcript_20194/g.61289 Transcript_20194/m.61289 type:complete len:291 (+) Transcript_20194:1473-2345(+)